MTQLVTITEHGEQIIEEGGRATPTFQLYLDNLLLALNTNLLGNQVQLTSYEVADLPAATTAGGMIYVSDETGGAVPAFSDGTNWRRVTDRVIVS